MLETERLQLRQLTLTDAPFIIELVNSPGWLKNIGDRHIKTVTEAETYLQNGPLASYEANGFGLYLVALKADQTPVGMCGLIKRTYLETPDIGFAFLPAFTGKGYAAESATATMAFAENTLKLPVIAAIVMPTNDPSIKLLAKLGMTYRRQLLSPDTNEELMLFST
ncbi:GNAT family N-acetyltransferase [uncultured Fibrella sp.]|uniref:GNAT family N-acetyltransferase n=1 Tax=uncultured Fibrella sp. TaxID=1284596 RepID=UPI0035CA7557